jgi:membrane associated rhomboid family serine protease/Zn-finger nucleic acid-binding protein
MEEIPGKSVLLDICPSCNSIWFDSGELFKNSDEIKSSNLMSNSSLIKNTHIKCPSCSSDLDLYRFSKDNTELEFEKCPTCNGFWFDKGEYQKIRQAYSFIPQTKKIISRASAVIPESLEDEIYSTYRNVEGQNPQSIGTYITSLLFGIPFEYKNQRVQFPWTIFFIVITNFLLFFTIFISRDLYLSIFTKFVVSAATLADGALYTLVSYSFIHMDILHVSLNMYFMWIFGDNVFDVFLLNGKAKGRIYFILYFCICAAIASFGHLANTFISEDFLTIPLAGASGVTSALVASYYRLFPESKFFIVIFFFPIYAKVKFFVLFFLATNIMYAVNSGINSGISWQTHIAGFIAGYFLIQRFVPEKALHLQDYTGKKI